MFTSLILNEAKKILKNEPINSRSNTTPLNETSISASDLRMVDGVMKD